MLLMLLLASALLGGTLPRADRPRAVRVCLWALLAVHALLLVHVLFFSRAGLRAQSWEEYRFISHRLASTRFCDRIILIAGGRI